MGQREFERLKITLRTGIKQICLAMSLVSLTQKTLIGGQAWLVKE
jgi:hypothetical protein